MSAQQEVSLRLNDIREGENTSSVRVICDPAIIGVLTQVRRTMDEEKLTALAQSIQDSGQFHPGIVAALTPEQAPDYIAQINELWGTGHKLSDYRRVLLDSTTHYLFLIAGHQRHEAVTRLLQLPSNSLDFGGKFRRGYVAELRFGITVDEAIRLQFQENIGTPPPPAEQAAAAWDFWRWRTKREPKLSYEQFSRDIGHKTDWFRGARLFCQLPPRVQEYAWGRQGVTLPYGTLVHLANLADKWPRYTGQTMPEAEIESWILRHVLIPNRSSKSFGEFVNRYLEEREMERMGQHSLFGGGQDEWAGDSGASVPRKVVAAELIRAHHLYIAYTRTILSLIEAGKLGKEILSQEEEMFSPGSPARLLVKLVDLLKDAGPQMLEAIKGEKGLSDTAERLAAHEETLRSLATTPEEVRTEFLL